VKDLKASAEASGKPLGRTWGASGRKDIWQAVGEHPGAGAQLGSIWEKRDLEGLWRASGKHLGRKNSGGEIWGTLGSIWDKSIFGYGAL